MGRRHKRSNLGGSVSHHMDAAEASRKTALVHLDQAIRMSRRSDRCEIAVSALADGAVSIGEAKAHAGELGGRGKTIRDLSSDMLRAATAEVVKNCARKR